MYIEYYGLTQDPFKLTPDPQFFFLGEHQNKALAHLIYGINNRKGFIALTGEVGAGKTTLCRLLLKQLDENVSVAIILNSLIDGLTLMKQINRDFAIPYDTDSLDDLVGYLYDFLIEEKKRGRNVVVIVDECQNLKFDVLEQLRMLSNLETEKDKLLQILLIGQPEFIDMLNSYELRQLNQRITVKAHISSLSINEMERYIYHRLKIAGNENAVIFTRGALKKIYRFSQGIPRRINVITDYSLLAGYAESTRKITPGIVKKALKDIDVKRELSSNEKISQIASVIKKTLFLFLLIFLIAGTVVFSPLIWKNAADFSVYLLKTFPSVSKVMLGLQKKMEIQSPETSGFLNKEKMDTEEKKNKPEMTVPVKVSEQITKPEPLSAAPSPLINKEEIMPPPQINPQPVEQKKEMETKPEPQVKKAEIQKVDEKSLEAVKPEMSQSQDEKPAAPRGIDFSGEEDQELKKNISAAAVSFFNTLEPNQKGMWLLLSTWGMEISHPRKNENGELIPLMDQLSRFNFTYYQTWPPLELLKIINIPFAIEIADEKGNKEFWVVSRIQNGKMKFYQSPESIQWISEAEILKRWQGNTLILAEKGPSTLEGDKVLYLGMKNPQVIQLKNLISQLGYEKQTNDDLFDLPLENAIKSFQKKYQLMEDGICSMEIKLLIYSLLSRNIPRIMDKRKPS